MTDRKRGPSKNQEALASALVAFCRSEPYGQALLDLIRADGSEVYRAERSKERRIWNLYIYPSEALRSQFDIQLEILCSTAPFTPLHPRVMSAFDRELAHQLRYEPDFGILVAADPQAAEMVQRRAGLVAILVISTEGLVDGDYGGRNLAHLLNEVLLTVDHFDVRRPLTRAASFFGRSTDIDRISQLLRNDQHVGVFGLRKAGKSSLLNQVRRVQLDDQRPVAYMELNEFKSRSTRFRRVLTERLAQAVRERGFPVPKLRLEGGPSVETINEYWLDDLEAILDVCRSDKSPVIVIDEIDHAAERSHGDEPDLGRSTDERYEHYVTLTQLRGLAQTRSAEGKPSLCFLVAGVDSAIFESATQFDDTNSLYQMATIHTLGPMSDRELQNMTQRLGRRSGVKFASESIKGLHEEYGGHPFLSRQACSFVLRSRPTGEVPWEISPALLESAFSAEGLNTPLAELRTSLDGFERWYPDEAQGVLSRIVGSTAAGSRRDLEHAIAYGLLKPDTSLAMRGLSRLKWQGLK